MNSAICRAIRERHLIRLSYGWGSRLVEPHAYGRNNNGNELLRVFQASGASESGEPFGWKLLRVDEINALHIVDEHFAGPRQGYRPGDSAMDDRIYCQL